MSNVEKHLLYPLACRLNPALKAMESAQRTQNFVDMLMVAYLSPWALTGLIWLVVITTPEDVKRLFTPILLLTITQTIINFRPATLHVETEPGKQLVLTGSLGTLVSWAALLSIGPAALWADLLASIFERIREIRSYPQHSPARYWNSLNSFLQDIGSAVFAALVGFTAYRMLGGTISIQSTDWGMWIHAVGGIGITALVPGLILLPMIMYIGRVSDSPLTFNAISGIFLSIFTMVLIPALFSIPISMLYAAVGMAAFFSAILGIILVNLLAYSLSQANLRSQQQTREMTILEKLGEEIIQSQPDGSELHEILKNHVNNMFQSVWDVLEIRLFEQNALHIVQSRKTGWTPADSPWRTLKESSSHYLIFKDQFPPEFKQGYAESIAVKIFNAAPGQASPICIGGIFLLRNRIFARTIDSLGTLQALASQVASALYRVEVYQETLAAQKMSQELEFAGKIQASFLPESIPDIPGWSIAASLIPARQTSGDFYDFISLPENRLGILAADVADKGTGAALYMALCRTLLRTFAFQKPDEPAEVLRLANERILSDSRADQFVTVFYGVLDPASGHFEYCNAGHNPAMILRENQKEEFLKRTGIALGAMEGSTWKPASVVLKNGDTLLLYTDGVTEAQNKADEIFGEDALLHAAKSSQTLNASDIREFILKAVNEFVAGAPQFDDITLLVLKHG